MYRDAHMLEDTPCTNMCSHVHTCTHETLYSGEIKTSFSMQLNVEETGEDERKIWDAREWNNN